MTIRIALFVFFLMNMLGLTPAMAAEPPPGCDSCQIQIDNLDHPYKLNGKWLFTRDDSPQNKDVDLDTTAWRLVKAPGPWKGIYEDKKVFPVGWYRGTLEFNPALVGQEVVLLLNTYMGRVAVYVDGKEVYRRPNNINVDRYFSTQAIPVRFTITQPRQVVAIRVDTPLMIGVYQLPFELRKYDEHDVGLVAYQILGGEARVVISYVVLLFGVFFLLVYSKTRYPLYLICALSSIFTFPFFAGPGDYLLGMFAPETMLYLHYPGMFGMFFFFIFSQFFHKFTPKINWIGGGVVALLSLIIGSMAFHPNVELFQHVRGLYFVAILISGFGATYMLVRGTLNRKPGAAILLVGELTFMVAGFNDFLLALGAINSYAMIFYGGAVDIATMLYVASNSFANTFVENKALAKNLTVLNENLEELVAERTKQLREKTLDIHAMLQNMPQGVLTIEAENRIHPEYSAYLATIFETGDIAGRNLMQLVFADTKLSADELAQIEAATAACIGEDRMNFDFNAHLLVTGCERRMADGRVKSLELSWSPICDEDDRIEKLMLCVRDVTEFKRLSSEANAQKRELEIIGEILAISQEKFHEFIDRSLQFVEENDHIIRKTTQKDAEAIAQLFRNMHTIKGNARTYGLLHMTSVVHETEMAYDELRKNADKSWEPEVLLEQLALVRGSLDEYARINDITLGRKGPGRRGGVEQYLMVDKGRIAAAQQLLRGVDVGNPEAMRAALTQLDATLNRIGTEGIDEVLVSVIDSMPALARELGKEAPQVIIDDHGLRVRTQIAGLLKNLFMHLLRNAMDHGLEGTADRLAAGKPASGTIRLTLGCDNERFLMHLTDDGRGLALARIRDKALQMNLITDAHATPEAVAQTIFRSGFSTADRVSEISGRGVGMDAVRAFLQKEGGTIEIRLFDGAADDEYRPFELVISLPARFAVQTTGQA